MGDPSELQGDSGDVAPPLGGSVKKPRHPQSGDLYTLCSDQFYELLEQMYVELGSWRTVAMRGQIRMRALRNIRHGSRKAISMRLLDRLTTGTGVGSINDFVWFTADDLVALGVWKPVPVFGSEEYKEATKGRNLLTPRERELLQLKKKKKRSKERRQAAKGWTDEEVRKLFYEGSGS